jgi:HSP20 family protein
MALPTRVNRGIQYDPFESTQRDFDTLLSRWFGARESQGALAPYGVDVREDADHIYVEAELPGFRKEDVDITLENNTLTITAERLERRNNGNGHGNGNGANPGQQTGAQPPQAAQSNHPHPGHAQPGGDWLLRERRFTRFQRSFTLPDTVNEQTVNARLQDGLLTVTLNKREETKPRKVQVN